MGELGRRRKEIQEIRMSKSMNVRKCILSEFVQIRVGSLFKRDAKCDAS